MIKRSWNLANHWVRTVGSWLTDPFLFAVRLYWGWQFFQTGKGKLMNLDQTAEFFESLSIPLPKVNAMMAGSVECFGGLLLLIGLASRLISVPLVITMVVAYLTADLEAVKGIFSDPDTFVSAAPFLFMLSSVIVFIFGPGKISVDYFLLKEGTKEDRSQG